MIDFERLVAMRDAFTRTDMSQDGVGEVHLDTHPVNADGQYVCHVCNDSILTIEDNGSVCRQCVLMERMFGGLAG